MPKQIKINQPLSNYRGEPFRNGDREMTLGDALLEYFEQAFFMGLPPSEQVILDRAARALGKSLLNGGVLHVSQDQYDTIKKLTDSGLAKSPQGQEFPIFPSTSLRIQIRDLVNAAEHISDEMPGGRS